MRDLLSALLVSLAEPIKSQDLATFSVLVYENLRIRELCVQLVDVRRKPSFEQLLPIRIDDHLVVMDLGDLIGGDHLLHQRLELRKGLPCWLCLSSGLLWLVLHLCCRPGFKGR